MVGDAHIKKKAVWLTAIRYAIGCQLEVIRGPGISRLRIQSAGRVAAVAVEAAKVAVVVEVGEGNEVM
jgi:hypothetical protein